MIAAAAVRVIAATLPAGVRERYREEWLADVAGASAARVAPGAVVMGALGVAVHIDRDNPAVAGIPVRRLLFRRLRVALAALGATLLILLMSMWWGVWTNVDSRGLPPLATLSWLGRGIVAAAVFGGLVALLAFGGALRALLRMRRGRPWRAVDTAVAVTLPLAVAATVLAPVVSVPLLFGGAIALIVVLTTEDPREQGRPLGRGSALLLATLSGLGILAMLAGSLLHTYVWNPVARMPGMTLDEIYAGLAAAGELPSPALPIAWALLWCLVVLALIVCAALPQPRIRRLMTARRLAGFGILGIAVVAGGSWFVGFGMGMGMADAFMTSGGDAAASGPMLTMVGILFALAALLIGLLPSRIRPSALSKMQEN
ncbi:MAG: hypothetical protein DI534_09040 [Leifsonia xyli]|nr:MAG: hypothetical protein DI534_09040 [Leifsonia xyli]